ncbi:hypothetical protein [Brevundimonas sp. Marseille-Q4549]
MLMAVAIGEAVYWAHRFRRALILSPLATMGLGAVIMLVRNWPHLFAMAAHHA